MTTWRSSEYAALSVSSDTLDATAIAGGDKLVGLQGGAVKRFPRATLDAVYAGYYHRARHQDGGADEVSLAALSGLLADPQSHTVYFNGALVATRPAINLTAGTGATVTVVDNAGASRVDVTLTVAWSF